MEQKNRGCLRKTACVLILLLAVLTLGGCGGRNSQMADPGGMSSAAGSGSALDYQNSVSVGQDVPAFAASSEEEEIQLPEEPQPEEVEQKPEPDTSEAPSGGNPEPEKTPEPVERTESNYDFSQPVPETEPVDNEYFHTAAFVGDSRTDGFLIYSGVGGGKNLTSNGLSIFKLAEKKAMTIGGKKYTLLEALALDTYDKVYLSLGVNELGVYDDEGFYRSYCEAIDAIRAIQPEAVIYIQGLIPLNEGVIAQTIKRDYLTNEHLRIYNDLMRKAAQDKQVAFLDLYNAFVDENGELPADASHDGVHLSKDYCKKWLAYLQTHTVGFEDLYGAPVEDLLEEAAWEPSDMQEDIPAENGSEQT